MPSKDVYLNKLRYEESVLLLHIYFLGKRNSFLTLATATIQLMKRSATKPGDPSKEHIPSLKISHGIHGSLVRSSRG